MSSVLKNTFGNQARWVIWKLEKVGGKITKIPYNARGGKASSTDHKTWSTYDECKLKGENIGIMFGVKGQLLGIDIDHCVKAGVIEHEKKAEIEKFLEEADTYAELSPSKTGLHIILFVDEGIDLLANKHSPYEAYSKKRYFTVTEIPFGEEKEVRIITKEEADRLLKLIGYPWGKGESKPISARPENGRTQTLEDSVILEKMFASKNGKKIKALYEGDTSDYKKDDSNADMGLCSHLAFWTGRNATQMERIWISSPLGNRAKTQDRKDYRDRTINSAIEKCTEVYEAPAEKIKKKLKARQ